MKQTVALIVGHRPKAQGAVSRDGLTEFMYNSEIVPLVAAELKRQGKVDPVVVYRDTYATLPAAVNKTDAAFAVSFHANGYSNALATGTEVLHWHTSTVGAAIAKVFLSEMLRALGLRNRGVKAIKQGERGARLLRGTTMPCVIVEPFFLTNTNDKRVAVEGKADLVAAYVRAVTRAAELISG